MALRKVPRLDMEATYTVARRAIALDKTYAIGSDFPAKLLPKHKIRIFLEYGYLVAKAPKAEAPAPEPEAPEIPLAVRPRQPPPKKAQA